MGLVWQWRGRRLPLVGSLFPQTFLETCMGPGVSSPEKGFLVVWAHLETQLLALRCTCCSQVSSLSGSI